MVIDERESWGRGTRGVMGRISIRGGERERISDVNKSAVLAARLERRSKVVPFHPLLAPRGERREREARPNNANPKPPKGARKERERVGSEQRENKPRYSYIRRQWFVRSGRSKNPPLSRPLRLSPWPSPSKSDSSLPPTEPDRPPAAAREICLFFLG